MSRDVDRVLAAIDGVLDDYGFDGVHIGDDAMHWAPPWDEPIVRDPDGVVEQAMAQGWDGHAAVAYVPFAWRWPGASTWEDSVGRWESGSSLLPAAATLNPLIGRLRVPWPTMPEFGFSIRSDGADRIWHHTLPTADGPRLGEIVVTEVANISGSLPPDHVFQQGDDMLGPESPDG